MRLIEVIKAKVAGSMPTRLAFPELVAEGFQIVFLTTLDDTIEELCSFWVDLLQLLIILSIG